MKDIRRVTARFDDYESFLNALRALKQSGKYGYEAYGPTNLCDIQDLMQNKGSGVRIWATAGAFIGMGTFWVMCVVSSLIYGIVTGGKPPISNIPFVIPAYEGTILCGAIGTFIGICYSARFSPRRPPADYHPSFSGDSYGIIASCDSGRVSDLTALLAEGAVETQEAGEAQ